MKKPTPVENWRKSWKWFSVQAMTIAASVQGTWMPLPEEMKSSIPQSWISYVTIALMVLGVIGRLVKQDE